MKAIIITIGDEILMGQILNSNAQYIARQLTLTGMEVTEMLTIADREEEIRRSVDYAMQNADLVITTGGLGPTRDDITKKVLAEYFGTTLKYNEEVMQWLEELLRVRNLALNENNKTQAMLPENSRLLRNFKGTACGMWFEKEGKILVSMPGVPFEMEHLMETYVITDLQQRFPNLQLKYRLVKVYGIPESVLAERLIPFEDALPKGLGLAYLPSPDIVKLRLTARGETIKELDNYYSILLQNLKGLYFTEGEDSSVEKVIGELLQEKGYTLATAESCTGGYIAHLITSIAGSSNYFKGSVVSYSNEMKENVLGVNKEDIAKYGAVSEQVVMQMAEGIKCLTGADCVIATSGVAGPDGGTPEKPVGTVWIAIITPNSKFAQKYLFSFTRERNIAKAAVKALELVRKMLKENRFLFHDL